MPTRAELLAGADVNSKKIQEEAKANPSDLLSSLGAAFDQQNQTLLKGLDSRESFGKLLEIVSPTGIGTLIGKGAKTWNAFEAETAAKLEELGASAERIWQNTGTYKGPIDAMLRQEIPDMDAALKPFKGKGNEAAKLSDLLDHKKLYEAYPELANMPVRPGNGFMVGTDSAGQAVMMVDPKVLKSDPAKFLNIMIHEVQHGVQKIEGFTKGGSPSSAQNTASYRKLVSGMDTSALNETEAGRRLLSSLANNTYRKLGGEAEARAVQARQHYDPKDLKKLLPTDSYDVALDSLIKPGK